MTRIRVLVIDDEAPIVDLVRGYLERDGMEVISASDGEQGLARIREQKALDDALRAGIHTMLKDFKAQFVSEQAAAIHA